MQVNYQTNVPDALASEFYESKVALRLAGLMGIRHDLDNVRSAAVRLHELLSGKRPYERLIAESLTWHAVVRYGRCFDAGSKGRGTSLSKDHVAGLDGNLVTLHEGLLARRDGTFAHAGDLSDYRPVLHLMPERSPPDNRLVLGFVFEAPGPIADPDQALLITELIDKLTEVVWRKVEDVEAVVRAEINQDSSSLLRCLEAKTGRFATPEQTAISVIRAMQARKD